MNSASVKAGPSPLPKDLHYDSWRGDIELSDPIQHPLDAELSALCQRFAASDHPTRSQLRNSASLAGCAVEKRDRNHCGEMVGDSTGEEEIQSGLVSVHIDVGFGVPGVDRGT